MINLIISWNTYDWIKYCSGLILQNPELYRLMIICKDDEEQVVYSNLKLCPEALYAQRRYDIFNICKDLGIKNVSNLQYYEDTIDIYQLSTQINVLILMGGIKTVYCIDEYPINKIVSEIVKNKTNAELYFYGKNDKPDKIIKLDDDIFKAKRDIMKKIVAPSNINDLLMKRTEIFYK